MTKPNPNVYDPGTYPAFNSGQPMIDDSWATQPAVPGRRRGMTLGGVCRGFGITGLVVFALVVVGTLVYVMIPTDDYSRGLAPLAFIFMAGFGSIPVVAVNIIGLIMDRSLPASSASLRWHRWRIPPIARMSADRFC